jgi:hypothetical protein
MLFYRNQLTSPSLGAHQIAHVPRECLWAQPAILVQAGTNDRGQRISGDALFASRQKAGGAFATFETILGRGHPKGGSPDPGWLVSWKNPIYKWMIG